MKHTSKRKDPRAAATARGSKIVALGKPTPVHNANLTHVNSTVANDQDYEVDGSQVIFEHVRSGSKRLIVQFAEWKGHPYLDVREWMDGPGGRTPTKKGVSVPLGVMRRLGEALLAERPAEGAQGRTGAS